MVKVDFYKQRDDGVNLYRTFSDADMMIRKVGTEEMYSEAIDVENSGFEYVETDIPIDEQTDEPTEQDYKNALKDLGVNMDD